jgi:hypothetical protein
MISEPPLLVSSSQKNKSVLVACSLVRYARHTQTVNLYAPLTLRFGLTHDRPCVQVWSGGRLSPVRDAGHVHVCRTHAFRSVQVGASMDLYRYCIEDLRVHTSSVAARSARPPRSYRVRHRRLELWTPPQERRGLCEAPDTRMWLNARKSRRRDFVCFRPQAPRWKGRVSSFPTRYPEPSESNYLLNPTAAR